MTEVLGRHPKLGQNLCYHWDEHPKLPGIYRVLIYANLCLVGE